MKSMIAITGLLFLARAGFAQEPSLAELSKAQERAAEARRKVADLIGRLDGIQTVGLCGSGTDYRLLVVAKDQPTRRQAEGMLGGASLPGVRILWSVREASLDVRAALDNPPPLASSLGLGDPAPAQAGPAVAPPSMYDCDLIREHLKLPPLQHPAGDGRSWPPCQIVRRTVEGQPGAPAMLYAQHRPDCPIGLGQVPPPAVADSFVAWVFGLPPGGGAPAGNARPGEPVPAPPPVQNVGAWPPGPAYGWNWSGAWVRHGWVVFHYCRGGGWRGGSWGGHCQGRGGRGR
jgi:hypothetical protein